MLVGKALVLKQAIPQWVSAPVLMRGFLKLGKQAKTTRVSVPSTSCFQSVFSFVISLSHGCARGSISYANDCSSSAVAVGRQSTSEPLPIKPVLRDGCVSYRTT